MAAGGMAGIAATATAVGAGAAAGGGGAGGLAAWRLCPRDTSREMASPGLADLASRRCSSCTSLAPQGGKMIPPNLRLSGSMRNDYLLRSSSSISNSCQLASRATLARLAAEGNSLEAGSTSWRGRRLASASHDLKNRKNLRAERNLAGQSVVASWTRERLDGARGSDAAVLPDAAMGSSFDARRSCTEASVLGARGRTAIAAASTEQSLGESSGGEGVQPAGSEDSARTSLVREDGRVAMRRLKSEAGALKDAIFEIQQSIARIEQFGEDEPEVADVSLVGSNQPPLSRSFPPGPIPRPIDPSLEFKSISRAHFKYPKAPQPALTSSSSSPSSSSSQPSVHPSPSPPLPPPPPSPLAPAPAPLPSESNISIPSPPSPPTSAPPSSPPFPALPLPSPLPPPSSLPRIMGQISTSLRKEWSWEEWILGLGLLAALTGGVLALLGSARTKHFEVPRGSVSAAVEDPSLPQNFVAKPGVLELSAATLPIALRKRPTFLMFHAPWCPYCKRMESTWKELAKKLQERNFNVQVARVDAYKYPQLTEQYKIPGFPTLMLFDGDERSPLGVYRGRRDVDSLFVYVDRMLR